MTGDISDAYHGHQQLARWFRGWDKVWEEIELTKASGVQLAQDFYGVASHRGDRLSRLECYSSEADALKSAVPQRSGERST
jgi:hypothetical protein